MAGIDARKMDDASWFCILLLACMDQDCFWINGQTRQKVLEKHLGIVVKIRNSGVRPFGFKIL